MENPTAPTLNPGSDEARAAGCRCPVIDNNHGAGMGRDADGERTFVMSFACPLHAPEHLRDDAMHYTCTVCRRQSWDRNSFNQLCGMPQPGGVPCPGFFR